MTNTAPHTPSSWTLKKETTRGEFVHDYRIRDERDGLIATLGPIAQNANGALIAAAPDLLAALEAMEAWVRSLSEQSDANALDLLAMYRRGNSPIESNAQAAIARARGVTP